MDTCITCGEIIRHEESGYKNHHCNPTRESKIEGARKAAGNREHNRQQTIGARLNEGFNLLGLNER